MTVIILMVEYDGGEAMMRRRYGLLKEYCEMRGQLTLVIRLPDDT